MYTLDMTVDAGALLGDAINLRVAHGVSCAREFWAAAIAISPRSPDLALTAARLGLIEGASEYAMGQLDCALTDWPQHAGLLLCRAEVRYAAGDLEGSARDAAEAVVCDPRDAAARVGLGNAMLALGRVEEAIACLSAAVEVVPNHPGYRELLAQALGRAGNVESALQILREGILLCPESISIRNAEILLYLQRQDFQGAVLLSEQACGIGVADARTLRMRGHALSSTGAHGEAREAYQEALKLCPDDPCLRDLARQVYAHHHEEPLGANAKVEARSLMEAPAHAR